MILRGSGFKCSTLRDYMTDEKDTTSPAPSGKGNSKEEVALELMRTLKRTLDPGGILNPGKVI